MERKAFLCKMLKTASWPVNCLTNRMRFQLARFMILLKTAGRIFGQSPTLPLLFQAVEYPAC